MQGVVVCHGMLILSMIPGKPLAILIIFLPLGNDQGAHNVGGSVGNADQLTSLRIGNVLLPRSAPDLISLGFTEVLNSLMSPTEERTGGNNSFSQVNVDPNQPDKPNQKYNTKGLTKRRKKNCRHLHGQNNKSSLYEAAKASVEAIGLPASSFHQVSSAVAPSKSMPGTRRSKTHLRQPRKTMSPLIAQNSVLKNRVSNLEADLKSITQLCKNCGKRTNQMKSDNILLSCQLRQEKKVLQQY